MGSLGLGEILVILFIILLLFGAGRLPQIANGLGAAIRKFREETRRSGDQDPGGTER